VEKVEDEKNNYADGFLGKYYFFKKGTNGKGYKTDDIEPSIVKP